MKGARHLSFTHLSTRRVRRRAPATLASVRADDDARLRFGLFAVALAVALLLHQLWWDGFELASLRALVVLAAFAVLTGPTSVLRLLALLAAEVASVAADMPGAGSHILLVAVCAAAIFAWTAVETARRRALPEAGALFDGVAPLLAGAVVVLYVAAALAKLNTGFFDPAVSCAAALAPRIAWWDPALLDAGWLRASAPYATIGVEATLPILLLVRRTRLLGLALGVGFHLVLALAGNVPFTGVVLALYVAFVPAALVGRARALLPTVRRWAPPLAFAALVTGWLLGAVLEAADPAEVERAIGTSTRLLVLAAILALAALAARVAPARRDVAGSGVARSGHPVLVAALALLVLNAASPYVGWKTESSLAMYSNLQTEAGSWNHLLLPEAVRVFAHQDRLVTVTASNDPALLRRTREGTRMVRFEVERHLRLHPGTWATVSPGRLGPAPALAPVVDRVAKFRDVRPLERRGC